jgi:signal transduction histidine kinase
MDGMADDAIRLPSDVASVARARRWVLLRLGEWSGVAERAADDVGLVVTELVTNAVQAGAGSVELAVERIGGAVRIGVVDDAPGTPTMAPFSVVRPSGRGLRIVASLAEQWGARPLARSASSTRPAKETWAIMPLNSFGPAR